VLAFVITDCIHVNAHDGINWGRKIMRNKPEMASNRPEKVANDKEYNKATD